MFFYYIATVNPHLFFYCQIHTPIVLCPFWEIDELWTQSTELLENLQNVKVYVTSEEERFQGADVPKNQFMVLEKTKGK